MEWARLSRDAGGVGEWGVLTFWAAGTTGEKQVPHRAFGPVQSNTFYQRVRSNTNGARPEGTLR
jgi:hypothetical protein